MPENPLLEDPVLLKRLAKYIVQQCFRNTVLEEYHAGTVPDSAIGDADERCCDENLPVPADSV
jgi:hypothetical protein